MTVSRTISELGGPHILVNNAGTNPLNLGFSSALRHSFWETSPEAWSKVVAVNFGGPFFMARAAVGHLMAQGWGRIIGVTTSVDTMIRKGLFPYGPSKAGHEALVAIMAQELEGTGVTANVLVPGGQANTNLLPSDPELDRSALIQPEVMQSPVVWLASDASDGINGRRFIAHRWDESLPLEERLEKASAPVAWPQLGSQAVQPPTELPSTEEAAALRKDDYGHGLDRAILTSLADDRDLNAGLQVLQATLDSHLDGGIGPYRRH